MRKITRPPLVLPLLISLCCSLPFLYLLLLSVARRWTFPQLFPEHLELDLWRKIWLEGDAMATSFITSILLSGAVALLATACGFLASRFIAYHQRRRRLLFLAYLPFAISPVILGTCIHVLYIRIGLAGSVLGVIFAQLIFTSGFGTIFFVSFWNEQRRALEQMTIALGGTGWQLYRLVLLPIAREFLLICFLQTFLFSWFQYGVTTLIGSGRVKTLPVLVFIYIGEANIQYAALGSLLLVIPPVMMLWANKRFLYRYI